MEKCLLNCDTLWKDLVLRDVKTIEHHVLFDVAHSVRSLTVDARTSTTIPTAMEHCNFQLLTKLVITSFCDHDNQIKSILGRISSTLTTLTINFQYCTETLSVFTVLATCQNLNHLEYFCNTYVEEDIDHLFVDLALITLSITASNGYISSSQLIALIKRSPHIRMINVDWIKDDILSLLSADRKVEFLGIGNHEEFRQSLERIGDDYNGLVFLATNTSSPTNRIIETMSNSNHSLKTVYLTLNTNDDYDDISVAQAFDELSQMESLQDVKVRAYAQRTPWKSISTIAQKSPCLNHLRLAGLSYDPDAKPQLSALQIDAIRQISSIKSLKRFSFVDSHLQTLGVYRLLDIYKQSNPIHLHISEIEFISCISNTTSTLMAAASIKTLTRFCLDGCNMIKTKIEMERLTRLLGQSTVLEMICVGRTTLMTNTALMNMANATTLQVIELKNVSGYTKIAKKELKNRTPPIKLVTSKH